MRVVHIDTGKEMRGGQRQVLLLMDGLKAAGHESLLLAREKAPLWQAARSAGFEVCSANLLNVRARSKQAQIVHAHDGHAHTLSALAVKGAFVVSRRVAFPVKDALISRHKYARPTRFLAVSNFVAKELQSAGVPVSKIDVVFDAVEAKHGMDAAEAVSSWNAEYPVVALESRDPQKGRDLIEQAAAIAKLPVLYSIDLARDLRHASMFVYITRSEGLGSAALLAMSMGVPVIGSNVGGLPEAIIPGETGILVANEPDSIAEAMCRLRDHPALAHEFIVNAKNRIALLFTQQQLVDGTLSSYRRAIAG